MGVGPRELALVLLSGIVVVWPVWRILGRIGLPGILSLFMLVPVLNVVLLFFVAFTRWPIDEHRP